MSDWWKNRLTNWRSAVRWGVLSILTTLATSAIALSIAFYSVHLTVNGGKIMPSWNWEFVLMLFFGVMASLLFIAMLILAIGWFIRPDIGETSELAILKRIEAKLSSTPKLLDGMKRNGEKTLQGKIIKKAVKEALKEDREEGQQNDISKT